MKIYIATPMDPDKRDHAIRIVNGLREQGHTVYAPWEHEIEHAWDWPNDEWGLMVFENDITAIREADWVVVCSWGRQGTTAGTAWEQGFAFGIGKNILLVEMDDSIQSLMVANGRYATIRLEDCWVTQYFQLVEHQKEPPKSRTKTEQK